MLNSITTAKRYCKAALNVVLNKKIDDDNILICMIDFSCQVKLLVLKIIFFLNSRLFLNYFCPKFFKFHCFSRFFLA